MRKFTVILLWILICLCIFGGAAAVFLGITYYEEGRSTAFLLGVCLLGLVTLTVGWLTSVLVDRLEAACDEHLRLIDWNGRI